MNNADIDTPELELFDYNLRPKMLSRLKTYEDWHSGIERGGQQIIPGIKHIAKELGADEITVFETQRGKPVNFYAVGNPKAPFKMLIKGGHEDEFTYVPAIYYMMASFLQEGEMTDDVLKKVQMYFIECDDPDGFDKRAWTAVDMRGKEKHWPPEYFSMFNGQSFEPLLNSPSNLITKDITKNAILDAAAGVKYRDENGVYGDHIKSERILSILEFIDQEINPLHVAIDLHATYRGEGAAQYYKGAGILEIGHYPIKEEIIQKIYRITQGKKPFTMMGFFSVVPRIRKLLKHNIGFELGAAMMENVRTRGQKTYGGKYQAMLEAPSLLPQLIAADKGRTIMGWLMKDAEIAVCPEYLKNKYGTLGYTTETFPSSIPETVMQNMSYVEGGLKYITKKW
jgi:hypothetical protein